MHFSSIKHFHVSLSSRWLFLFSSAAKSIRISLPYKFTTIFRIYNFIFLHCFFFSFRFVSATRIYLCVNSHFLLCIFNLESTGIEWLRIFVCLGKLKKLTKRKLRLKRTHGVNITLFQQQYNSNNKKNLQKPQTIIYNQFSCIYFDSHPNRLLQYTKISIKFIRNFLHNFWMIILNLSTPDLPVQTAIICAFAYFGKKRLRAKS